MKISSKQNKILKINSVIPGNISLEDSNVPHKSRWALLVDWWLGCRPEPTQIINYSSGASKTTRAEFLHDELDVLASTYNYQSSPSEAGLDQKCGLTDYERKKRRSVRLLSVLAIRFLLISPSLHR